jgi:hypothetical protein
MKQDLDPARFRTKPEFQAMFAQIWSELDLGIAAQPS